MKLPSRFAWPWLLALVAVAGCGDSDEDSPMAPGPPEPPTIVAFYTTSSGGAVPHGEWTELNWIVENATGVTISPDLGARSPVGSQNIRPPETVTYTLRATNEHGTVQATTSITVTYEIALYVDVQNGDDGNTGATPASAIQNLSTALARSTGGGTIILAAGTYQTAVDLNVPSINIKGGRDPETFFEDPELNPTVVRPTGSDIALRIQGAFDFEMRHLTFDTIGGDAAVEIDGATGRFIGCIFDGRETSSGTALRILNGSNVQVRRSQILGGNSGQTQTRGVTIQGGASARIFSCFIEGGDALQRSTGVEINTTGNVGLGLNTISAEIDQFASGEAVAVRVFEGNTSIGGNIIFAQGPARVGIEEEGPSARPTYLEANLFISLPVTPYRPYSGSPPTTAEQIDLDVPINPGAGNQWIEEYAAGKLFINLNAGDYHLQNPILVNGVGRTNPAKDAGDTYLAKSDYGWEPPPAKNPDIDGRDRPSAAWDIDLGAHEWISP